MCPQAKAWHAELNFRFTSKEGLVRAFELEQARGGVNIHMKLEEESIYICPYHTMSLWAVCLCPQATTIYICPYHTMSLS